jgi:hypothetical protein
MKLNLISYESFNNFLNITNFVFIIAEDINIQNSIRVWTWREALGEGGEERGEDSNFENLEHG